MSDVEKDVNAAVKLVLTEIEVASREEPAVAARELDRRRHALVRAIWWLYKRLRPERRDGR